MSQDNDDDSQDFSALATNVPASTERPVELVPADYTKNDVLERDMQLARDSVVETIEATQNSMKELLNLADQSQNHLVYKAAGEFINALVNAQRLLADITSKRQDKLIQQNVPQQPITTNNTLNLTMSTQEALEFLQKNMQSTTIDAEPNPTKD